MQRAWQRGIVVGIGGIFTAALLVTSGCGADGIGCDFREGSVNGPEPRCQERTGLQGLPVFGATCEALQGTAIDGGCPREGAVAGCIIGSGGGDVIDWYYAPTTREEAEIKCVDDDGELVEP